MINQTEPVDDTLPAQDSRTADPALVARHQRLAELLDVRPGQVVVDLGCGNGATLGCVLERLDSRPGGAAVGLDINTDLLGEAAKALAAHDRGGRLLLASADLTRGVPLRDGSVDRILCHNLLECLPDPAGFMAEAHRLLRPGGLLVLGHADFDTLVFNGADLHLTRRLVHAYCDTQQPWMAAVDGTVGRRLATLATRSPFRLRDLVAWVLLSTTWGEDTLGHAYAHHVVTALHGHPGSTPRERAAWLADLEAAARRGAFLFSLNEYVAVLERESAPPRVRRQQPVDEPSTIG